MLVAGLTGGIGAGKTALAGLLEERGAHVIDADQLGRDALRPGRPAWHSVVAQFGDELLVPGTMDVDRKRLAAIVFNEPRKLAALNAIVHPVILNAIADDLEARRETDDIVVIDAALLREVGLSGAVDTVIVVTAPADLRRERLRNERGMSVADIDARMAAQSASDAGAARDEIVVANDGSLEQLEREAERVWQELRVRAQGRA